MAENGTTLVDVPDVVNNALLDVASKQGFKAPRFHVTSGSRNRDGYMSTLYRCVIRDEDAAGPADLSVMVKISREGMEEMMAHLFGVEALTYETLIPTLKELGQLRAPLPWPKCYFTAVQGGHPYCLALEDFKPEGFVMLNMTRWPDADHLRLALDQIARFHGAGMALERLRPDLFKTLRDKLPDLTRTPEVFKMMKQFVGPVPTLPGLVKDRWPEGSEVHTVLTKLCDVFKTSFNKIIWPLVPKDGRGCTFIHGDCHVNNMAFKYDQNGKVEACKLYDFQATAYRIAAQDLMWLMFCNTEKATRDKHWDSLLRGYVAKVHETLRAAGFKDVDEIYSWDILQEQMRRLAMPTLCMMPIFSGLMNADDSVVNEVRENFANPTEKADGDGPAVLRLTPTLIKEYEGLVEDVVRWGWLPSLEDIDRIAAED
ncbi:Pleckstrin homology domain-containing family S member 1 [Frankliniella fusca]|uniref:Pleckstrin homology domain-containing family S member 1 n=1 Tax=Frankliniella fusca TaxID=407009 RepID=A0AAE1HYT2_9NEOP|nr:Pleckstrin homology domain-containing family S member 1 [Frankliniella fusca]